MNCRTTIQRQRVRATLAFTLVEVMVALLIFFMAVFTILGLLAGSLKNARLLQKKTTDCGPLATLVAMTNRLYEGSLPAEVIEQFEQEFPDFTADGQITEIMTNGLFQVEMAVLRRSGGGGSPLQSKMTIWLYRPESPPGSMSRGMAR